MVRTKENEESWEKYLLEQFDFRGNYQFINTLLIIGERLDSISRETQKAKKKYWNVHYGLQNRQIFISREKAKKKGYSWSCKFGKLPDTVCSEKFFKSGRLV